MHFISIVYEHFNIDFQTLTKVNTTITYVNLKSCESLVYPTGQDFEKWWPLSGIGLFIWQSVSSGRGIVPLLWDKIHLNFFYMYVYLF